MLNISSKLHLFNSRFGLFSTHKQLNSLLLCIAIDSCRCAMPLLPERRISTYWSFIYHVYNSLQPAYIISWWLFRASNFYEEAAGVIRCCRCCSWAQVYLLLINQLWIDPVIQARLEQRVRCTRWHMWQPAHVTARRCGNKHMWQLAHVR